MLRIIELHLLNVSYDYTGVEDAFCATGKVLTVSFHKHGPGFFPGILTDVDRLPQCKHWLSDSTFIHMFFFCRLYNLPISQNG